jgi:hypothetical protein
VQHQVNLRGTKKHHDTIRDMMATSSHVFSSICRGGTQWVYGGRLFVVSARTNKGIIIMLPLKQAWLLNTFFKLHIVVIV